MTLVYVAESLIDGKRVIDDGLGPRPEPDWRVWKNGWGTGRPSAKFEYDPNGRTRTKAVDYAKQQAQKYNALGWVIIPRNGSPEPAVRFPKSGFPDNEGQIQVKPTDDGWAIMETWTGGFLSATDLPNKNLTIDDAKDIGRKWKMPVKIFNKNGKTKTVKPR